jgi:hypothetical protein
VFFLELESTLYNMQIVQSQMFTMIQEIQKNVNEIYMDWKSNGGLSNHIENDTRWIEVNKIIYLIIYILIQ